jgi:esterase/lipase superfamily enzyme
MAQIVEDTDFEGVPVLFTWASAASASRYVYDLNSALVARARVPDVVGVLERTGAESVELFAHSMGTFLAMEGLVDGAQTGRLDRRAVSINHIILASPDIDLDLFRAQLGQLPPAIREKMYLLVSQDDGALRASRLIAGGVPRVGAADAEELEKLGVTVIDLSQIDDSSSGSHAKFAGSPEVVQLLGAGLNTVGRFGEQSTPALNQILARAPIRILGD